MQIIEELKDRLQGKAPPGAKRSKTWRKTRAKHLKKFPRCRVCGRTTNLSVHHIIPFYLAPDLEEVERNLITLCERPKVLNCHLILGHLGNYRKTNPSCEADVMMWYIKLGTTFTNITSIEWADLREKEPREDPSRFQGEKEPSGGGIGTTGRKRTEDPLRKIITPKQSGWAKGRNY